MRRLLAVILFCAGIFCLTQSNAQFNGCPAGFCTTAQLSLTGAGFSGGGGGGGFTPASLTNLVTWLDASVTASLTCTGGCTTGNPVTNWKDQSGNAYNYPKGTTAPLYSSNGFNSTHPKLGFSNSTGNTFISASSAITALSGLSSSSWCLVANFGAAINAAPFFFFLNNGDTDPSSGTHSINFRTIGAPDLQVVQNSSGINADSFTTGQNHEYCWVLNGSTSVSYVDNVQQSSVTLTGFTFGAAGQIGIGGFDGLGFYGTVDIPEIIVTGAAFSSTDRSNLHTYDQGKWGTP